MTFCSRKAHVPWARSGSMRMQRWVFQVLSGRFAIICALLPVSVFTDPPYITWPLQRPLLLHLLSSSWHCACREGCPPACAAGDPGGEEPQAAAQEVARPERHFQRGHHHTWQAGRVVSRGQASLPPEEHIENQQLHKLPGWRAWLERLTQANTTC